MFFLVEIKKASENKVIGRVILIVKGNVWIHNYGKSYIMNCVHARGGVERPLQNEVELSTCLKAPPLMLDYLHMQYSAIP